MRLSLFWRVLPVHILIALILAVPFWQRHEASVLALQAGNRAQARLAVSHKSDAPVRLEGLPAKVLLPRLSIDVGVVSGIYDPSKKIWSVASSSANYAPNTAKINNKNDQTLIYGHWTPQVLGPTKQLVPGDIAYVYTDNNHVFKYMYQGKGIVKPTDIQIFDHLKGKPGLVLMTCEGSWAQNRRLMFFNLVGAQ